MAGTAISIFNQIAAIPICHPFSKTEWQIFQMIRSLSVPKSLARHRPQCQDTALSIPAWSAQGATGRRADSWCVCALVLRIECVPYSARSRPSSSTQRPRIHAYWRVPRWGESCRRLGKRKSSDLSFACFIHACKASRVIWVISN